MTEAAANRTAPKQLADIPRLSLLESLREIVGNGGGRIDMRSGLQRQHREYGNLVRRCRGPLAMVTLFGPDANRLVLLDRDRIFSARRPWMMIMGRIFPNGLLLMDGDGHRHHRRIMQPTFKRPVLRQFVERMHPMIEAGISRWRDSAGEVRAFPLFKELTLDMAASIFLGVDLGADSRAMKTAFENMVAASMSAIRLPIPGLEFYRGLKGRQHMLDFLGALLAERRRKPGDDMFSRLSQADSETGESFDDQQVLDHMVFLMMAAHDTTTSTLSSLTYELARHPEWQERLREESRALACDHPGFDALAALPNLTNALYETLRLYPPLPVIPRVAEEAFEFGGYTIPANTMVVVAPIHTHYMPEWWEEPQRFDPGRFAPERAEHMRHTHSWIPFGGGPHMCLGRRFAEAQVRSIVHQMLLRYRWSVREGYRMPVQQAPISVPRDGLPIRLTPLH